MFKYAHLTCALALSAAALSAQVAPVSTTVQTTGIVGIADAQTAQLNLLNPGVRSPAIGVICSAIVAFVDANGAVLKSTSLAVPPGKSLSFGLRSDADLQLLSGERREIRATISIPFCAPADCGGANASGIIVQVAPDSRNFRYREWTNAGDSRPRRDDLTCTDYDSVTAPA